MKTLGPCNVSPFVAQSHTPCNRCVRFATTVASGPATLATKRTLLLTWAGLSPAGSHQLCLAHSFDHLVGTRGEAGWHFKPEAFGRFEVDHELEFRGLINRQLCRLLALEYAKSCPIPMYWNFFCTPSRGISEKRCNHYRLIGGFMRSGASQDRPVIVGCSTAPRGQFIGDN